MTDNIVPLNGTPSQADSPFSLDRFRLPQDYSAMVDLKEVLTSVSLKRPHKKSFVRVHPDEIYSICVPVLEFKSPDELFLVDCSLMSELADEVEFKTLFTSITAQGERFLWPVGMPNRAGQWHPAHASAWKAAQLARTQWIRVAWNPAKNGYDTSAAQDELPNPKWSNEPLSTLVQLAFNKGQIIETLPKVPAPRRKRCTPNLLSAPSSAQKPPGRPSSDRCSNMRD